MAFGKGVIFVIRREERIHTMDLVRHLDSMVKLVKQFFRRDLIGLICVHGRTNCSKKMGIVRMDDRISFEF